LFDETQHAEIARRFAKVAFGERSSGDLTQQKFEASVVQLLDAFAKGGYTRVADMIEKSVPEAEREKAAQTYLKIVNGAAFEAYNLSRERSGKQAESPNEENQQFLQESLNAISDLYFYGAPFYLQLTQYEHREASGLQLTKSPGKNLVYSGSVLLVLGIFAMIYIRERRIWLLVKPQTNEVLFAMSANRKNRDLDVEYERYKAQLDKVLRTR
jgi:cytochrome c biogenesis protein